MLAFQNVRRGTETTVVAVAATHVPSVEHWLEELGVTGWQICDAATIRKHLGRDFPLEDEAPVWPAVPGSPVTGTVAYFVSFFDPDDVKAAFAGIIDGPEDCEWKNAMAAAAAKARAYDEKRAADPAPFDFRRDL